VTPSATAVALRSWLVLVYAGWVRSPHVLDAAGADEALALSSTAPPRALRRAPKYGILTRYLVRGPPVQALQSSGCADDYGWFKC
jgi:hypothetical protein